MRFDLWELAALCSLAISLAALAIWGHIQLSVRRLAMPLEYASQETLVCTDGGVVELRRVPIPPGVPPAELPPVLLVHGLAANHRNQDMHPDYSLARYLAGLGRDVWLRSRRRRRIDRITQRRIVADGFRGDTPAPKREQRGQCEDLPRETHRLTHGSRHAENVAFAAREEVARDAAYASRELDQN